MDEQPNKNLTEAFAQDEDLRAAMQNATSLEEAMRIAADHGLEVTPDDFRADDASLTDAELDTVSGGTILHPTMSVFCGTNGDFCTFNPYACQSPG